MPKLLNTVLAICASAMLLPGNVPAQTPASTTPQASQPAAPQSKNSATKENAAKNAPATPKAATGLILKTKKQKTSYAVGVSIGSGLKQQGLPVDPTMVARGLRDAMSGTKPLLTDEEMKAVLTQLRTEMTQQQQAKAQEEAAKAHAEGEPNRKAGEAFLAANKAKEGVVALPSGLQYKILKEGSGPKPAAHDTVTCNYRGTLIDGKEFDSSEKHGGPATFALDRVIKGWTEAVQLMPVGSKWQLFIPADLAYGDQPPSPAIAPGDTLIFEVELLSIGEQKK